MTLLLENTISQNIQTLVMTKKPKELADRITHHRAIEAAIWAMPLMNYKGYRDALIEAGVGPNDIGYYSQIQDWKFQTATPNKSKFFVCSCALAR